MAVRLPNGLTGQYFNRPPRAPPSPPMEDTRCSLPSISNLIGLADAGSPTTDPSTASSSSSYRSSPQSEGPLPYSASPSRHESVGAGSRPDSRQSGFFQHRRGLPPTPPLSIDASSECYESPASQARGHFSFESTSTSRFHESTPPLEPEPHRQHFPPPTQAAMAAQHAVVPGGGGFYHGPGMHAAILGVAGLQPISHYGQQQPLGQVYPSHHTVAQDSQHHYHHHEQQQQQQHQHPQQLWQHHHYLHPSQGSVYPQSQDKYLCPTCNKAFSRPSSLRIHSHSHTGEKPYKCAHPGCGKAFSVRSNMKRHERGCHSVSAMGGRPLA